MDSTRLMQMALGLAERGIGLVNPNPLVGAILVKHGTVVGRGYHHGFGEPHAEVVALAEAGESAVGSTMYVTLEPCIHKGKTPPCVDQIISAGVTELYVACRDPNPVVNGKGIAKLQQAGVVVHEGLLSKQAKQLNEIFFKFITTHLPFVQLKLAMSLDGCIASTAGTSKWISGHLAQTRVHKLRSRFAAILVGVNTVITDNPALTVRHIAGKDPMPLILDGRGRTPLDASLLRNSPRCIVVTATMTPKKEAALNTAGADVWRIPSSDNFINLRQLLSKLGEESIDSLLIEGGGITASSFLTAKLIDKVSLFIAPIILGGEGLHSFPGYSTDTIDSAPRLADTNVERLGDDFLLTGYPLVS